MNILLHGFFGVARDPEILIYCFHGLQGTSLLLCCSCRLCKLLRNLFFSKMKEKRMIPHLLTRQDYFVKSYADQHLGESSEIDRQKSSRGCLIYMPS